MKLLDNITPLEENFAKWYQDVVVKGNLIAYGPTKGSMIFKPLSYGIWSNIQRQLNIEFKELGVQNLYMPLLIPLSYIQKESKHIEGFAPELATITKVGTKDLNEHYVIRPTSEVLFGELFSKEVNSYNDLPIIYNQWANVVRWEKTTNPFLRNREFLWQEGHTVHSSKEEANNLAKQMINLYQKFLEEFLAIPTIVGEKTNREKFAGAETTYTIEAMMKDGKALQAGTTHYLAQNFSKPFDIKFKDKNNNLQHAYQTSWGVSTRLIGALIMSHGDNRGIVVPPKIATYQVDLLEIFADKDPKVKEASEKIFEELKDLYRVRIDSSNKSPGFKAGKSEIQGTPLRIEIGPRDIKDGFVTLVRRDSLEKIQVKVDEVSSRVKKLLDEIQASLYKIAKARLKSNLVETDNYKKVIELISTNKFVKVPFEGSEDDEEKIQNETGATSRCVLWESKEGNCIITNKKTKRFVIFARAY